MSSFKKNYHVYIMSNTSKMLYTGVTGDLDMRILRHKARLTDGFTKRYNIHRLVYFEAFGDIREAIAREKQIKGWLRRKKVSLIGILESRMERLGVGMDAKMAAFKEVVILNASDEDA